MLSVLAIFSGCSTTSLGPHFDLSSLLRARLASQRDHKQLRHLTQLKNATQMHEKDQKAETVSKYIEVASWNTKIGACYRFYTWFSNRNSWCFVLCMWSDGWNHLFRPAKFTLWALLRSYAPVARMGTHFSMVIFYGKCSLKPMEKPMENMENMADWYGKCSVLSWWYPVVPPVLIQSWMSHGWPWLDDLKAMVTWRSLMTKPLLPVFQFTITLSWKPDQRGVACFFRAIDSLSNFVLHGTSQIIYSCSQFCSCISDIVLLQLILQFFESIDVLFLNHTHMGVSEHWVCPTIF